MTPVRINAQTQVVGLIGWPVEHSLSPTMHNAAFRAMGLDWRYVPLPTPPGQTDSAVDGLAALGFRGANVTVPHKEAALRALIRSFGMDAVAPEARTLGAVNTLVVEALKAEGTRPAVSGYNTDAAGFVRALREGGFEPEGLRAVVIGAGGAARAVVFGLLQTRARAITVVNRTLQRAEAVVRDMRQAGGDGQRSQSARPAPAIRAAPLTTETLIESARTAELLVNATPLGMWPEVEGSVWPDEVPVPAHLTVFDLVYNPLETKLLRQARVSNAKPMGGLAMLVQQGALALKMWTGRDAPVSVMRKACERTLLARSGR